MTVRAREVAHHASLHPVRTGARGEDVPAALVVVLALTVSLATLADWLGWNALRSQTGSTALLLLVVTVGAAFVIAVRPKSARRGGARTLVLAVPAASVFAAAVVGALRGAPKGLEWFLNGDHPRHVVYVADTWAQGALTYAVDGYPRGWHSMMAAGWSVLGAGLDGESIQRLLGLMAAASLLLSAVLTLAVAHVGHALAIRSGLSSKAGLYIGLVTGSLSLLNVFLANYQALGYENSILGAVVVAVCCREVLVRAGSVASLVVCSAGVVVVAHSWQLILPAVGVAALWCAWVALRTRAGRMWVTLAPLAVGSVVFGSPGVLAVARGVGLDHAAEPGPESPVPVLLLILGAVGAVVVPVVRRDLGAASASVVTLLPAVTAVSLSVTFGLELFQYYPSKLLWQSAVMGLPWVVVLVSHGIHAVPRRWRSARLALPLVGGLTGVVMAYLLILPWGSQVGAWATVDGDRVIRAVTTPRATDAAVVWLDANPTTDSIARILLDAMRVEGTRVRAPQARLTVAQECEVLEDAERPIVLSTESDSAVRGRYSCVADLVVLGVRRTG